MYNFVPSNLQCCAENMRDAGLPSRRRPGGVKIDFAKSSARCVGRPFGDFDFARGCALGICPRRFAGSIARLWFHAHYPAPGQTYNVDGRKMYMECTRSGSPTIVLDAGLGNDSIIWSKVQPALAKTTRVQKTDAAKSLRPGFQRYSRDADGMVRSLNVCTRISHDHCPRVTAEPKFSWPDCADKKWTHFPSERVLIIGYRLVKWMRMLPVLESHGT